MPLATKARALRVLLLANDGFSAGHVARTVAIAGGLARRGRARGLATQLLVATTSEADALLAGGEHAVIRLPAPAAARRAGFADAERRRIVRSQIEAALASFAPDLVVCDTFPRGPHDELSGVDMGRAKRALVRRAVPSDRAKDPVLTAGLSDYDVAILADDPGPIEAPSSIETRRVPPIVLREPREWPSSGASRDTADREEARRALDLPVQGRAILVAAGGGGDGEAVATANTIAAAIVRVTPDDVVVCARGPLDRAPRTTNPRGVRSIRVAPLDPWLDAFDGAFAPAGYNTAHELASARVPAALFARPRPFDDQAARAARFAAAGFACKLDQLDDAAIAAALDWMRLAPRPVLEAGGADRAADILLDLVTR